MTTKPSDDDLLNESNTVTEQATDLDPALADNPLFALHQIIAAMPDIDRAKVEAVLKKLQSGSLDILGTDAQRTAAENRIAARILEETLGTTVQSKTDD
jgi:hypothetical protein